MANPRLMIDGALDAGAELALDEAQARHVGTVLRLEAGDTLRVFNATDGEWRPIGDPTEVALLTVALKAGVTPAEVRQRLPRRDRPPDRRPLSGSLWGGIRQGRL